MTSAWDYKDQPSIWTRDVKLKMINISKINGAKRREQLREKENHIEYQCKPRKSKK
jgi:hypothetical protein